MLKRTPGLIKILYHHIFLGLDILEKYVFAFFFYSFLANISNQIDLQYFYYVRKVCTTLLLMITIFKGKFRWLH